MKQVRKNVFCRNERSCYQIYPRERIAVQGNETVVRRNFLSYIWRNRENCVKIWSNLLILYVNEIYAPSSVLYLSLAGVVNMQGFGFMSVCLFASLCAQTQTRVCVHTHNLEYHNFLLQKCFGHLHCASIFNRPVSCELCMTVILFFWL